MTINKLGLDQDDTGEPVIEQTAVMLPGGTPHCPTYPPRADAVPKSSDMPADNTTEQYNEDDNLRLYCTFTTL